MNISISAKQAMSDCYVSISVTGLKILLWRIKLGCWLVLTGCKLMGITYKCGV